MKLSKLLKNLFFICTIMLTHTAFAECTAVGMMGGCLPAAGMVEVPSHMKSQITNRVAHKKTSNSVAQTKASPISVEKKAEHPKIAIASTVQSVIK